jgi:dihydroorotate dehydrogenase
MYKLIYKLFLQFLQPETAHRLGIFALKNFSFIFKQKFKDEKIDFFGKKIQNHLGISAGFDKNAEAIKGLFDVGFGFVEVGTVTPLPQFGNSKPRIFRIGKNEGIINRMGFPNLGSDVILKNLINFNRTKKNNQIVGVNIGRNKEGTEEDYLILIEKFIKEADYITINVSSPNTAGLRGLLEKEPLTHFLQKISQKREQISIKKPFFLKISPDVNLEDLNFIYDLIVKNKIEGIIIANTTVLRPFDDIKNIRETGGLSGKFLKDKSLEMLKAWNKINKSSIVTISVGGIETKEDVRERIENGADFVQVYTSFAFGGGEILRKILT